MIELLWLIIALWIAYLIVPFHWFFGKSSTDKSARGESKVSCPASKLYIPEDAVLRRHFITHMRTEIEASLQSPRPFDSILQLDYDALVEARLEQRLLEIGSLQSC